MKIGQQILENILTEGIHLYAFVTDEDGNSKIIEDSDYPNKDSFKKDLQSNGYTVRRINDEKDMYIMDHSDYRSVNEVNNRIKQIEKDIKDGIVLPSEKQELNSLKDLLDKIPNKSLNEKASIDWNNYLTPEEVDKFLSKDDKVESAEDIIYSRKGNFYNKYFKHFKEEGWTKKELVKDLADFCYKGHLNKKEPLTEISKEFENWQQQIDNMSRDKLKTYLYKLYKQYQNFDDRTDTNIPPDKYQELLKKIDYIENKLDYEQYKVGRKLN